MWYINLVVFKIILRSFNALFSKNTNSTCAYMWYINLVVLIEDNFEIIQYIFLKVGWNSETAPWRAKLVKIWTR